MWFSTTAEQTSDILVHISNVLFKYKHITFTHFIQGGKEKFFLCNIHNTFLTKPLIHFYGSADKNKEVTIYKEIFIHIKYNMKDLIFLLLPCL